MSSLKILFPVISFQIERQVRSSLSGGWSATEECRLWKQLWFRQTTTADFNETDKVISADFVLRVT